MLSGVGCGTRLAKKGRRDPSIKLEEERPIFILSQVQAILARPLSTSHQQRREEKKGKKETYNTRDSPVVTHPSTSLAIVCLSMGERTGSRVLRRLWSYVEGDDGNSPYLPEATFAPQWRKASWL
ncbi:hypothetical protein NKR19_g4440 [Coniochaeta hoffmannii]|uniref:Uncharacterized protein n=1 Tax=Coniochaeta hoffmannii TaxID=91930 RepID=A0AA38RS94_9PEZI|nr:hypothetical protein NKR19_g4440 [Coniochaeta hoffmannii]